MDMTATARAQTGIAAPASFNDYFERWMDHGAWFRNVQSWWPHVGDDNVLWLRYEDMRQDLAGSIDRILAFLGWSIEPQQRARAQEYASFAWMKAHAEKFTREADSSDTLFRPGGFIRKGAVGDYASLLTPAHEARILEKARVTLEPECMEFLGLRG
jgi:hypothetical protein